MLQFIDHCNFHSVHWSLRTLRTAVCKNTVVAIWGVRRALLSIASQIISSAGPAHWTLRTVVCEPELRSLFRSLVPQCAVHNENITCSTSCTYVSWCDSAHAEPWIYFSQFFHIIWCYQVSIFSFIFMIFSRRKTWGFVETSKGRRYSFIPVW
jgi:hypothetical protein